MPKFLRITFLTHKNMQYAFVQWYIVALLCQPSCRIINDAFMHLMKHALFMEWNVQFYLIKISFFVWLFFQDTELLVLGCLKWDVSCVTPLDFIDLIISRLPIINKNCNDIDPEKIRKHAQAFISLAVRGKWNLTFFFILYVYCSFILSTKRIL